MSDHAEEYKSKILPDTWVYSLGLCYASICTNEPIETAAAWFNTQQPTGLDGEWRPSPNPTFADGNPNPVQCPINPDHYHYLLES